jgi:prepilin-type N-terminal cleavage/methylation domain-containing protein
MRLGKRGEDGFTLVELLMSITIIGIIAPTIVGAIVLGLKTTAATTSQLAASHNRQELAAFFTTDVQSAVTIADETSTDTTTCMSAGETLVGRLSWTDIDFTGASTARVVTYVTATVSGEKQLLRHTCAGAVMSTVTVVHAVVSGNLDCTTTTFAAAPCASAAGAKLTAVDAAGTWVVEGLTR